ncbi:DUF2500 domain-containing protein [Anaerobacillus alkaliphilus]|uniref:DUF2500 domain-containing protein n=1 Tax=Anaerobacillus alkaliphilus TaxID=1548597 RepID=A0A4Q0VQQ8_9BACI|nr:DUF2500 domain-containing protein [Anaerobacillus alkaliphilus]RXI99480.1 DUF2500 domain-containing protein [Anaerobacillus alkaliphilus]
MIDPSFFESSIFPILLLIVVAVIVFKIYKGVMDWRRNNKQPILTVNSKVISLRTKKTRSVHNLRDNNPVPTDYYATFVIDPSKNVEFQITGKEFNQLAEGDVGKLTFQGTRYHSFERL